MRQFRRIVTEYDPKLRELAECVPKFANSEEYLCSKFEEGLSLEIQVKMPISSSQSYKEMVQLALRTEKLTRERRSRGSFKKRKAVGFIFGQSSKKSRSSDSSKNFFKLGTDSVNSPQSIQSPQPSKLGTSPQGSTFRGGTMTKRCPHC